jgi:hypothetical protein
VFFVAYQAISPRLVETDFCSHCDAASELMALNTLLVRDASPRLVAGGAVLDVFVKETQRPRLSSRIIEKEPAGKRKHKENAH